MSLPKHTTTLKPLLEPSRLFSEAMPSLKLCHADVWKAAHQGKTPFQLLVGPGPGQVLHPGCPGRWVGVNVPAGGHHPARWWCNGGHYRYVQRMNEQHWWLRNGAKHAEVITHMLLGCLRAAHLHGTASTLRIASQTSSWTQAASSVDLVSSLCCLHHIRYHMD